MPEKKPKRKIMRSFKLDEVSAVDKPAQEGARMTLMKRASGDDLVSQIIEECLINKDFAKAYHAEAVESLGADVAKTGLDYFAKLETSLHSIVGDTSLNDQDKVAMMKASTGEFLEYAKDNAPQVGAFLRESLSGEEGNNTMNLRQLQKQMRDLNGKLDRVLASQKSVTRTTKAQDDEDADGLDMLASLVEKAEGGDEDATARLRTMLGSGTETTEKAGATDEYGMDPAAMEAMKAEGDEMPFEDEEQPFEDETEKSDSDEQDDGLTTTEGEEEEPIAAGSATPIGGGGGGKRATKRVFLDNEDTIIVEGTRVHKARVGPGLFAVLKSQQDRINRVEKQAQQERAAREVIEFTKVAEDELGHLPGTPEQKAHLLRKLGKHLDPEERQLVSKMFRAGDRGLASAFNTVGTRFDGRSETLEKAQSRGSFTKRVSEIRARDNCNNQEAMRKARREFPDDFADMQGN